MPKSDGSGGELCAFMGLLESKHPDVFDRCFAKFVLWGPVWDQSKAHGRPYTGRGPLLGGYVYTKDDAGKFSRNPAPRAISEAAWMRSWQAAYGLEMAGRTCTDFRATMWEYARRRIDAIRSLTAADAWLSTGSKAGNPKITFGDIFSSERGMALLLRLHVWRPAFLLTAKRTEKVEPILHDALKALISNKTLTDDKGKELAPIDWTNEHEKALLDAMAHRGNWSDRGARSAPKSACREPATGRSGSARNLLSPRCW
jgi:hypothetical protein